MAQIIQSYLVTVAPGLAQVVMAEARASDIKAEVLGRVRNHELLRLTSSQVPRLSAAEDVFACIGSLPLTGRVTDTKALATASWWHGPLRRALDAWSLATQRPIVKRLTWRVVVQADDAVWRQYRRQELTLAAERGLMNAGSSWRISREVAPLEVWLWQVGRELVAAVRLTTNQQRQHGGRETERAAALRPSVAAAMVQLAGMNDDDVFLDPMCGTGTILLERARLGRYALLLGGDNDPAAVAAALANFGPRHQPRRIERWDARQLPLEDGSVTRVVCNLPWGRQIGEKAAMPELYAALLPEFGRVLRTGGRMVLLTSEWEALKQALHLVPSLRLERTVANIEVLGRRADIFVIERV